MSGVQSIRACITVNIDPEPEPEPELEPGWDALQVGDDRPAEIVEIVGPFCLATRYDLHICNRLEGHTGQHVQMGRSRVLATWPQAEPEPELSAWDGVAAGDVVPALVDHLVDTSRLVCAQQQAPPALPYYCSLRRGHTCQHVALAGDVVAAVWPYTPEATA